MKSVHRNVLKLCRESPHGRTWDLIPALGLFQRTLPRTSLLMFLAPLPPGVGWDLAIPSGRARRGSVLVYIRCRKPPGRAMQLSTLRTIILSCIMPYLSFTIYIKFEVLNRQSYPEGLTEFSRRCRENS